MAHMQELTEWISMPQLDMFCRLTAVSIMLLVSFELYTDDERRQEGSCETNPRTGKRRDAGSC